MPLLSKIINVLARGRGCNGIRRLGVVYAFQRLVDRVEEGFSRAHHVLEDEEARERA